MAGGEGVPPGPLVAPGSPIFSGPPSPRIVPFSQWWRGSTFILPSLGGSFMVQPQKRSISSDGDCCSGWRYSTMPLTAPLPPPDPQLAESFSEMHLRCGYNNEKSSVDTNAPPREWTPGPLSIQPVSQSLPVSLAPLPFPPSPALHLLPPPILSAVLY